MLGKIAAALAALSLAATPALAQSSAQSLSLQPAAESAGAAPGSSRLSGGDWAPALLFAAIVLGGVLLATGVIGDDDDDPVSP